jgi:hypothetical protein
MVEVAGQHTIYNEDDDAFISEEIGDFWDVQQVKTIMMLESKKG